MAITQPPIDFEKAVTSAITVAASAAARDPRTEMAVKDIPAVVAVAKEAVKSTVDQAQANYDYATNNESLPTSYSFTGGLTAFLSQAALLYNLLSDGYQPSDAAIGIPAVVTIAGVMWVLYGRLVRSKPIGS